MLNEALNELRHQRDTITAVIAQLEALRDPNARIPKRRGRKSMGATERLAVASRMRAYWEARRKERSA